MRNLEQDDSYASARSVGAIAPSDSGTVGFGGESIQSITLDDGDYGHGEGEGDHPSLPGAEDIASPLGVNIDGTGGTVGGKPVWTLEQAVANLNRANANWTPGPNHPTPASGSVTELRYGFFASQAELQANGYVYSNNGLFGLAEYFNFATFTDAQKAATREAMRQWDDLIAPSIVETTVGNADINFGNLRSAPTTQAYAYLPSTQLSSNANVNAQIQKIAGDVWVSASQASNFQLDEGGYGAQTLVHEAGHALGLQHPGAYNAAPGLSITYANNAEYAQDTRAYTVMSYFNASSLGARHFDFHISTTVYAATPLIHDIAAIQAIYGADLTTRTGDTTYGFNSNAGRDSYDFNLTPAPIMAIYDAGGIDTLDASGYDTQQLIDLTPGSLSSIGGVTAASAPSFAQTNANRAAAGFAPIPIETYNANIAALIANPIVGRLTDNVGIAYGTIIENAIGGSGSDNIIGNSANNYLKGNAGDDILFGRDGNDILDGDAGDDILDGGTGADIMNGGIGNDIYYVDNVGDQVNEAANAGIDEVRTTLASYTLKTNFENLTGTSATGQTLIGNSADNVIKGAGGNDILDGGAGNDTLDGGAGADTMTGGAGNDIYYVDNVGDRVVEGRDGGTDEVRTTLATFTLASNFENLTGLAATGQTLVGNTADNVIQGGAGNDVINGLTGNDTLRGGAGNDTVDGGTGDDFLYGDAGADTLLGGAGADTLFGGADNDILDGGSGNDILIGGAGNDILTGGSGSDTFVFAPGSGADQVTDFRSGDVLDWSAMTAAGYHATITQSGANTLISFEDGSTITLNGVAVSSLRGDWFHDAAPPAAAAASFGSASDDLFAKGHTDWVLAA